MTPNRVTTGPEPVRMRPRRPVGRVAKLAGGLLGTDRRADWGGQTPARASRTARGCRAVRIEPADRRHGDHDPLAVGAPCRCRVAAAPERAAAHPSPVAGEGIESGAGTP